MKILRKIGWFLVAMLPMLLSIVIQFVGLLVVLIFYAFQEMLAGKTGMDALMAGMLEHYMNNPLTAVLAYQLIALPVFGLWYYFAYGRKRRPESAEKPGIKGILTIVASGVLLQVLLTSVLSLLYILKPELLQGYMDMMELAGITETTWLSLLAAVIMAPLGEELIYRGIVLRLAGKVSSKFWVANCIQALAFGIFHLNLVQGIYAFFLGLILGYLYGKYHNIWICMLLHGVINLSANFSDPFFSLFPEGLEIPVCAGGFVISLGLLAVCYRVLGRIKPGEEEAVTVHSC